MLMIELLDIFWHTDVDLGDRKPLPCSSFSRWIL